MPYYVFAWLTNIFYGFGSISSKLSSKHQLKNPWHLNVVLGFFITLFIIPLAILNGVQWPHHWGVLWLAGLFSMLAGTLYVFAMFNLDISILSPLYSLRMVFSLLIGVLSFQEHISVTQFGYIALIILAGVVVSADEHTTIRSFIKPAIGIALSAILCSAIYSATLKYALQYEGFWEVTLWNNILGLAITLITYPLFHKDLYTTPIHNYSGLFISSIAYTLGTITATKAFETNISLTSVIMAVPMSMIMAVIFSFFSPKLLEKHTLKVYIIRFSAASVMVFAAILLSR